MLENNLSEPKFHVVYAERQFDLGILPEFWENETDRFQHIIIGSSINFKHGIRERTQSGEPKETQTFALSVYDFPLDTPNELHSGNVLIQLSSVNWIAY
jgi:hypothetical protein